MPVLLTPRSSTSKIAVGAMLSALSWMFLVAAGILPTGRLFLLGLASFVILVAFHEIGKGGASMVYLVSFVLTLLWPGVIVALLYGLCFGMLPLLNVWLRGKVKPWIAQITIHFFVTLLFLAVVWIFGIDALLDLREGVRHLTAIIIGVSLLQIFLLVFYYALQSLERFYLERIGPWIRLKF